MAEYVDMKTSMFHMEMKVASALKQRKIFLSDEISRESLFEVSYFLYKLEDLDKKIGSKEPIEIVINSYGGYIYDGNMLLSQIEQMINDGYEIITTISGYAMSMGFAIALAGNKRQAYKYARLMAHQPSSGSYGTLQQQQDDIDETVYLWEQLKEFISKNSKITKEQLDFYKERNKDWYMSSAEAFDLGVIHKIL